MSERLSPFQCLFDLIFIICEDVFDRSWDSNKADFFTSNRWWMLRTWTAGMRIHDTTWEFYGTSTNHRLVQEASLCSAPVPHDMMMCQKLPSTSNEYNQSEMIRTIILSETSHWKSWALNTASILKNITIIYNRKSHRKLFFPPPFLSLYHGYQLLFW